MWVFDLWTIIRSAVANDRLLDNEVWMEETMGDVLTAVQEILDLQAAVEGRVEIEHDHPVYGCGAIRPPGFYLYRTGGPWVPVSLHDALTVLPQSVVNKAVEKAYRIAESLALRY